MPTTTTREQQEHWHEIVNDPLLSDLPYKLETNARGQILLSPHSAHHSDQQGRIIALLGKHAPSGLARPEFPLCTEKGIKMPDVAWITDERRDEMRATGDPPTLAPEICIEVMSQTNDWDEMHEKRALYREAGAKEVWIVDRDEQIHVFRDDEREHSNLVPEFPSSL
jgi:Uma2 family endonuclease